MKKKINSLKFTNLCNPSRLIFEKMNDKWKAIWSLEKYIKEWYDVHMLEQFFSSHEPPMLDIKK
jgi:hypothetical protein